MNINIYNIDSFSQFNPSENTSLKLEEIEFLDVVKIEDLICPLSKKPNLDPIQLIPCGHIFDRTAINQWYSEKKTLICPIETCQEPVTNSVINEFFKKTIAAFIKKSALPTQEVKNKMIQLCSSLPSSPTKINIQIAIELLSQGKLNEANQIILNLNQTNNFAHIFSPLYELILKHTQDVTDKQKNLFQFHNQPTTITHSFSSNSSNYKDSLLENAKTLNHSNTDNFFAEEMEKHGPEEDEDSVSFIKKISPPTQKVNNKIVELYESLPPSPNKTKIQEVIKLLSEGKRQEANCIMMSIDQNNNIAYPFIPLCKLIIEHMQEDLDKQNNLFQLPNQPTATNYSSPSIPILIPTQLSTSSLEPNRLIPGLVFRPHPSQPITRLPEKEKASHLSNIDASFAEKIPNSQVKRSASNDLNQPAKRRRFINQGTFSPTTPTIDLTSFTVFNHNQAMSTKSDEDLKIAEDEDTDQVITAKIVLPGQEISQSLKKNRLNSQQLELIEMIKTSPVMASIRIRQSSNVNFQDENGNTLLHYVILNYITGYGLIDALFSKKINLDTQNLNGETALHLAVKMNKPNVVKLLLLKGASATIRDNQNQLPIEIASKQNIRNMLKHHFKLALTTT